MNVVWPNEPMDAYQVAHPVSFALRLWQFLSPLLFLSFFLPPTPTLPSISAALRWMLSPAGLKWRSEGGESAGSELRGQDYIPYYIRHPLLLAWVVVLRPTFANSSAATRD